MSENKDQLFNEYDRIVRTIATNVIVERSRCNKYIIHNFISQYDSHKLLFNVTTAMADLNNEKIYLDMSLLDYLKFKKKRGKNRLNLRWFGPFHKRKMDTNLMVDASVLMNFIANSSNIDTTLYKEINDEYYGWVD